MSPSSRSPRTTPPIGPGGWQRGPAGPRRAPGVRTRGRIPRGPRGARDRSTTTSGPSRKCAPAVRCSADTHVQGAVGRLLDGGRFPVVLGGDCSVLLGALLARRRRGRCGLVFLDAHADFYQPEAEPAGELASMELALATGHGPAVLADLDGLRPLGAGRRRRRARVPRRPARRDLRAPLTSAAPRALSRGPRLRPPAHPRKARGRGRRRPPGRTRSRPRVPSPGPPPTPSLAPRHPPPPPPAPASGSGGPARATWVGCRRPRAAPPRRRPGAGPVPGPLRPRRPRRSPPAAGAT